MFVLVFMVLVFIDEKWIDLKGFVFLIIGLVVVVGYLVVVSRFNKLFVNFFIMEIFGNFLVFVNSFDYNILI